jgi:dUTP pyrophosphatase
MTTEDNTLGELNMVPVAGEPGPTDTVALETAEAAPTKKKAGRPSNAEKAVRAAAPQAEARTATGPVEPAPAKVKAAPASGETVLGVFAMNAGSVLPELATSGSGAFDVRANLHDVKEIVVYTASNKKSTTAVRDQYGNLSVILQPRTRAMIPTGLIFDIPAGFKLELSARSGLSLKEGLNLANGQALIDSDYVEETFILIQNNSDLRVEIKHGDRIAQAALARVEPTALLELSAAPARKSERAGGLGSTGVQ